VEPQPVADEATITAKGEWLKMVVDLRGTERELHAGFGGDMGVAFIRS
jgi:hypothetical protein